MKLTERFEDYFFYKGMKIELHLPFDVVLRVFELLKDDSFLDFEKIDILIEMLVKTDISNFSLDEKLVIWETILFNFIYDSKPEETDEDQIKVFDMEQDAKYIYASFLYDYGMDLFEQQGKLHWKKFRALLDGLNEKTKLNQVISIRTMEIPKADKNNQKERDEIRRLKEHYALKLDEKEQRKEIEIKVKQLDDKLGNIAQRFKPKGVRK